MPFKADVTNKSEFFGPPKAQLVIFLAGKFILCICLANLFKTQVYQLAKFLSIPSEILQRKASPDTWSFDVSDEEFFFSLPYEIIDLLLYAKEQSISLDQICSVLNLKEDHVKRIVKSQERKWNSSKTLRIFPPSFDMKDFS